MESTSITATELKRRTAQILNEVHYQKRTTIIERHGRAVAKLVPMENQPKEKDTKVLLKKYYGIMPDFPEVTTLRYFRKRDIKI